MREAKVILPGFDNDGRCMKHVGDNLANALAAVFGGCTVQWGYGYDPTQPKGEPVGVYTVAYELDDPTNDGRLAQIALEHWRWAGQLFGYIRYADGTVRIVDIEEAKRTGRIPLQGVRVAAVPGFDYRTDEQAFMHNPNAKE